MLHYKYQCLFYLVVPSNISGCFCSLIQVWITIVPPYKNGHCFFSLIFLNVECCGSAVYFVEKIAEAPAIISDVWHDLFKCEVSLISTSRVACLLPSHHLATGWWLTELWLIRSSSAMCHLFCLSLNPNFYWFTLFGILSNVVTWI